MGDALEVSEMGSMYAWWPEHVANFTKLVKSRENRIGWKLWGLFAGHINWLMMNWLDRSTNGGHAAYGNDKVSKSHPIKPDRSYQCTSETIQTNVQDANLYVCHVVRL